MTASSNTRVSAIRIEPCPSSRKGTSTGSGIKVAMQWASSPQAPRVVHRIPTIICGRSRRVAYDRGRFAILGINDSRRRGDFADCNGHTKLLFLSSGERGPAMARDAVANMVDRLRERGFEPRRVGEDAWEARCPAHRSTDHALAITRNAFNHVELECRSSHNCRHFRIVGALGITNDHLYAETPDWLIERLKRVPIESSLFAAANERQAGEREEAADLPVVDTATSHGLPDRGEPEDATDLPAVDCAIIDLPSGRIGAGGNLAVVKSATSGLPEPGERDVASNLPCRGGPDD